MGDMNWDRERERLIALYAGLQDGELKDIASEIEELTAVARAALLAEMSKRGMRTPPASSPSTFVSPESRDITREPEAPPPIRLRRYRGMPEAMIAGSILDSAAIECFLVDDNLVRMNWFYSDAIGGIKLLVRPDDSAAADEMLKQDIPERFDLDGIGQYEQPKCPRCNSLDVGLDGLNKPITFTVLFLLNLPIIIVRKGWHCHSCGKHWREADAEGSPSQ